MRTQKQKLSVSSGFWPALVAMAFALPLQVPSQTCDDFNPGANGLVGSFAEQADGKILVGGTFTVLGGQNRNFLGRLNVDGRLDTGFNPGANRTIVSWALQADGKIVVGGAFTELAGQVQNYIGRFNSDGTLDANFNSDANNRVYAMALQADGKILVGGSFTTLGGQGRNFLGRLNVDGTVDMSFNPGADNTVFTFALQADGKILVGGSFTTLGGQGRSFLGRLNGDGTVDTGFNPGANGTVSSMALQADGKLLAGGYFTTLRGQSHNHLGRINADGTVDGSFNPAASGWTANDLWVASMATQADGKILVGGSFTVLNGQARNRLARLQVDGTLDATFGDPAANNYVHSLAVQRDGKIVVGGYFTTLAWQPRNYIGRLANSGPATQALNYDAARITWLRGGTSPEVWRTTFEVSTNLIDWINLGAGTRIPGGWQLAGIALPENAAIRARGHTAGGVHNGSSWFLEALINPPTLLTQPVSLTTNPGATTTFTVTAMGMEPLTYQWRLNGTNLAGATGNSLPLTNVQVADAGVYSVRVSNALGTITSSNAVLTVNLPPTVSILTPINGTVMLAPASFTLVADATDDLGVAQVAFWSGANLLGTVTNAPWYVRQTNLPPGMYHYRAAAVDIMSLAATSAVSTVAVLSQPPTVGLALITNGLLVRQTGLFYQTVRVSNPTATAFAALRLWVKLDSNSVAHGVRVWNATGQSQGVPYLAYNQPLAPGQSAELQIEYFVPDRRTLPNPIFWTEVVRPEPPVEPEGALLSSVRKVPLTNGLFLVEFATIKSRVYYVQYTSDINHWNTALPAIIGTGSRMQWLDNGPPKTASLPSSAPTRFYRVILLP